MCFFLIQFNILYFFVYYNFYLSRFNFSFKIELNQPTLTIFVSQHVTFNKDSMTMTEQTGYKYTDTNKVSGNSCML